MTNGTHTGGTAQRAELRQSVRPTTVAARQPADLTIIGKRDVTGIATGNPATVSTNQGPGITFPIEEEQDLGMVLQRFVHRSDEFVAEESAGRLVAKVNEFNRRSKDNFLWDMVDLSLGIEPRFKGWVSRGQYNKRRFGLSSQIGDLPGMIARLLRFFQGRILFSFHPDQTDRTKG